MYNELVWILLILASTPCTLAGGRYLPLAAAGLSRVFTPSWRDRDQSKRTPPQSKTPQPPPEKYPLDPSERGLKVHQEAPQGTPIYLLCLIWEVEMIKASSTTVHDTPTIT